MPGAAAKSGDEKSMSAGSIPIIRALLLAVSVELCEAEFGGVFMFNSICIAWAVGSACSVA